MRWLVYAMALLAIPDSGRLFAADQWIRAKLGPFEAISDDGRPAAIQALSQFEQFRYALGAAMGQHDLRLRSAAAHPGIPRRAKKWPPRDAMAFAWAATI